MQLSLTLPLAALLAIALPPTALAQVTYPSGPLRIVSPYPPGGGTDILSRTIGQKLNERLGQPVVVENRAGANGTIGAAFVAKSPPDGQTMLIVPAGYAANPALYKSLPFDQSRDLAPVSHLASGPLVLVVHPSLPAKSVRELIALAKAKPGEINCASAGNGTPPHLACELFNAMAGVKTVHVPFRDANAAMNALLGNHVQMLFAVSANARALIEGRTVSAVAIASAQRSELFPGIPTMGEAGLPGFEVTGWGSFMAPAATPKPVIDALNAEMLRTLDDPEAQQALARLGQERPPRLSPTELAAFVKADIARWNRIIDTAGIARPKGQAK
jgi:tripartite-type tricarboxylate transporter receptor subunit TctC